MGDREHAWQMTQDGRRALLRPGDFVLVDTRRPYHFDFANGVNGVSLGLPLAWVTQWLVLPEAHVAQTFRLGEPGFGAALAGFAGAWNLSLAAQPPMPPQLLVDQLGALLALACSPVGAPRSSVSLAARIENAIRARLAEPGLIAADVAADLNVSVRSLHRAMQGSQQTFAQVLLRERMHLAAQMLKSPHLSRLNVGEIGRRVGIVDASHFSRLCSKMLGHSPRHLR
jgi:AraC family transcriptional regulator, positive regulator of tynA and feaB